MIPDDESRTDAAWREIVDNFGDRVSLDPEETATTRPPSPGLSPSDAGHEDVTHDVFELEDFRPPTPPPVPTPRTWQRGVAWAGLFAAPTLGAVLAILHVVVAPLISVALVTWCVGGFCYLIATMSRSPRDPWDDGSRV